MPKPKIIAVAVAVATLAVAAIPSTALARHGHHRRGHSQMTVFGTIASFQGGVLTVKRADGTTASAAVTPATEIECQAPGASGAVTARIADHGGTGAGEDKASGRGSDDSAVETENEATEDPAADQAEVQGQDDQAATQTSGDSNAGQAACDETALLAGTSVTATTRTPTTGPAVFKQIKIGA